MRILMVLEREYPEDERVSKEIRTLCANGHEVVLACYTKINRKPHETINGIEIFRSPISKFIDKTSVGALKAPFYFNFWIHFIKDVLNSKTTDAIHIHDLPLAKVGFKISREYKLKFILDLHENWPVLLELSPHTKSLLGRLLSNNKQWLKYEKKYASLADVLVVVAEGMKERLINRGVSNKNIAIVPNTSSPDIFERLKDIRPDAQFVTLYYAGGINRHRGLDIVIKGLSKTNLPDNFRFRIIGEGKNRPYLKKMVDRLKLGKYVIFMGWKAHNEVLELLFSSDIAVIPHLRNEHTDNTSPNKIFHYMLAKKPVLSSDCKYLKNIIDKTQAGLVYTDSDPSEFAEKLEYLLQHRETWSLYGENGYRAVIETFNWENTSRPLIKAYQEL